MQLESRAEKTSSPIVAFLYYQKRPVYFLLKLKSIINMRCEGFQSFWRAGSSGGEGAKDLGDYFRGWFIVFDIIHSILSFRT